MKRITTIALLILMTIGSAQTSKAQLIEIKPWQGTYPDMEGTYPLTFIAFKGWLIPEPHVFVRIWPTHYYLETDAMPVTDEAGISGELQTGLLRILAKALERSQMKGRMEETEQIKINTDDTHQISQKLFDARSDELSDIYKLSAGFILLYQKLNSLEALDNSAKIHPIYEKEADQLLLQFLSINFLQTDHGSKLQAFTGIDQELSKLRGELDYTFEKLRFFNNFNSPPLSFSFLTK